MRCRITRHKTTSVQQTPIAPNMPCTPEETHVSRLNKLHRAGQVLTAAVLSGGLAALPLMSATTPQNLICAIGVPVITALVAFWLTRSSRAHSPTESGAPPGHPDQSNVTELPHLLSRLLPVWHAHVQTVQTQIDSAVGELIQSFSSVTDQFEAAGFKGAGGQDALRDNAAAMLAMCEERLQEVIALMGSLNSTKGQVHTSMTELLKATHDLQEMAQGVAQIAAQTNLLAINAAIEAAHAGDAGRGFATVAKEIRSLSQSSADTASRIKERISRVTSIMQSASETAVMVSEREEEAIDKSGQVVQDVLDHMRNLSTEAETMLERGNVIRGQVERLIVSLQFQDRVNQVISVIDNDIQRLNGQITDGGALPEADAWLADLKQQYTMREQRQVQAASGSVKPSKAGAAPQASRKVVFF